MYFIILRVTELYYLKFKIINYNFLFIYSHQLYAEQNYINWNNPDYKNILTFSTELNNDQRSG